MTDPWGGTVPRSRSWVQRALGEDERQVAAIAAHRGRLRVDPGHPDANPDAYVRKCVRWEAARAAGREIKHGRSSVSMESTLAGDLCIGDLLSAPSVDVDDSLDLAAILAAIRSDPDGAAVLDTIDALGDPDFGEVQAALGWSRWRWVRMLERLRERVPR